MAEFEKAQFCMDAIEGISFAGYSNGDTWNGFACPYFEKDVAEQVLQVSTQNGYTWQFDLENDAFIVKNTQDPEAYEPEKFVGRLVTINGGEVKVYPVGAYSWIWGECE